MMTLSTVAGMASRTARTSACTACQSPAMTLPMSITMSTSLAPSVTERAASVALMPSLCFPLGKPQTVATFTAPRSSEDSGRNEGETHTL